MEATERRRERAGDSAVFDARKRPTISLPSEINQQRTLDNDRQRDRQASRAKITPFSVCGALLQRQPALVDGVDLGRLRGVGRGGKGKIRVATGIRQDLQFIVHAAKAAVATVGQSEIAVHEGIPGLAGPIQPREATVARQFVTKLQECAAGVRRGVRPIHAMVEMNFYFAPPRSAVLHETLYEVRFVLLGGIKISVAKGMAVGITIAVCHPRILDAPLL